MACERTIRGLKTRLNSPRYRVLRTFARLQFQIQSTPALRTPRFYGHPIFTHRSCSPGEYEFLKITPATTDFRHYGHKTVVPKVSVKVGVDCIKNYWPLSLQLPSVSALNQVRKNLYISFFADFLPRTLRK